MTGEIVEVKLAQLVDTESETEETPSEAEELQSLGSRVPHMGEEFETFEPTSTRTDSSLSSASSDSTTPLSPDHPLTHVSPTPTPTRASFHHRTALMTVRAQPVMSPSHSARVTRAMALSDLAFHIEIGDEDTNEDGEDESLDADDERERSYNEGHGLDDEGHGLDDNECSVKSDGLGLEVSEEEVVLEGQQQAAPAADTAVGKPLGLGYGALRRQELAVEEDQVLSTFEIGQSSRSIAEQQGVERLHQFRHCRLLSGRGSFPISPSSLVVLSPIASPVATPTATISIDEDQFIEIGAQLKLYGGILQDHTQCLDVMPPTLFVDIDRDVRELYTRSGAVRDEIFSQMYRLRSLEHEQERAVATFRDLWRLILALEAWAGQTDRENHDLRMQLAEERRERLDLVDHVARIERRQKSREE
ncbi:hypothetical protein Tco_0011914 [Tanacetum coccineum]